MYIHTYAMEYYASIRNDEIMKFTVTWMELLNNISETWRKNYHQIFKETK